MTLREARQLLEESLRIARTELQPTLFSSSLAAPLRGRGNMTAGTPPRQSFCYQAAPWAPGMLSCSVEGTFGCSLGNREHRIRKLNRGREREAGIRAVRSECVLVLSTARLVVLFSALA